MKKRTWGLLFIAMLCLIFLLAACNKQPEKTETVFNKRFISKISPMMPYEQLVKIIGTPGVVVKDAGSASPQTIHYHWNGGRNSALDARVAAGKLVDATILAPNGNTYQIGEK
jgi:hypothetical protein